MRNIVGVRFNKQGKVYIFDVAELPSLRKNEAVVVQTENGLAVGQVVTDIRSMPEERLPEDLKKVIRRVTEEDMSVEAGNRLLEAEAKAFCLEQIRKLDLPMKLVGAEYLLDRSKIMFYFTAENRVDFRELVKDLVQKFKTRIELRQIGVRNEARICGGVGICGRELCCVKFLQNLDTVSVKMAKEQNMLLNPEKISGLCGRLMCCLSFEYDAYLGLRKTVPKAGKTIETAAGRGEVVRHSLIKETVTVRLEDGKEIEIKIEDLQKSNSSQPVLEGKV
jgi:cell fate regulator YaaT (PSP1 superfamily)